jgi:nicotinate-nucleotide adenylyltransferase
LADGKRIGLLGGSFNPAHRAHRHISLSALKRLALDEVWWLVSPQNPLKSTDGMASLQDRIDSAKKVADDKRIKVADLESEFDTRYTVDTLRELLKRHPEHRFVWLMGADNFIQLPEWKDWRKIFRLVPIAIFPRPTYSRRALSGKAARRFSRYRIPDSRAHRLAERKAPAWVFVSVKPDAISATQIRSQKGADWTNE